MADTTGEKKDKIDNIRDLFEKAGLLGLLEDEQDGKKDEKVVIKIIKQSPGLPPYLVIT